MKRTTHNDPDIKSKIDFSKKVNFVIHGWLGGLYDGNMHSPLIDRSSEGLYILLDFAIWKIEHLL